MSEPEVPEANSVVPNGSEGEIAVPACVECQSNIVRPSRSAYPQDATKRAGGDGSFWRCDNCGARFLGPAAPERKRRHHRRGSRDFENDLSQKVKFARSVKRFLFPIVVIIATIIAVIYILDRRSERHEEQIAFPG